jgi:hypothetical protein
MGIAGSGRDFENAFFNSQEREIESSTSKVEEKDVAFVSDLPVDGWQQQWVRNNSEILKTGIVPASLVAWRCESLTYAGRMTTALPTVVPR